MDWMQVTIYTTTEGIEPVSGRLYQLGINGIEIEDESDFQSFLEENRRSWDYVDEDLTRRMSGETKVKIYLSANASGNEMLQSVRASLQQLKAMDVSGSFGRLEISLENYSKAIRIEALAMLDMLFKDILPAAALYTADLTAAAKSKKELGIAGSFETELASKIATLSSLLYTDAEKLKAGLGDVVKTSVQAEADYYHDVILKDMGALREAGDELEKLMGGKYLPYPTYSELLFGVY